MASEGPVRFAKDFEDKPGVWRLLELEPEVEKALSAGASVYVKGPQPVNVHGHPRDPAPDEDAVLCSSEKTWRLRIAEDSHLRMFGAKAEDGGVELRGAAKESVECLPTRPRYRAVRRLLQQQQYGEVALDDAQPVSSVKVEYEASASAAELKGYLSEAAVHLDGDWRWVSSELVERTQEAILASLVLEDMEEFDVDGVCEALSTHFDEGVQLSAEGKVVQPRTVVEHVLRSLTVPAETEGKLRVDPQKVTRIRALQVLQAKGNSLDAEGFYEAVKAKDVEVESSEKLLELLRDCTYMYRGKVHHIDASELAEEPITRLAELFRLKPEWSEPELTALLSPVMLPGEQPIAFLAKQARVIYRGHHQNGEERIFVNRAPGLLV